MQLSKLRVSVIIPTYNSWTTLKDCIGSINKQSLKPIEIIVIDNASSDGTSSKVKKQFPNVKLTTLNRNTGVTGGRNAGIKAANQKTSYLLFFDHDMVAEKNMIENLVRVAAINQLYGILTPKIYYWTCKNRIWAAGTNINLFTGQVIFRGGVDTGQFDIIEEVQVAPAVLMVKHKVINKIGGFDDRYFLTYEDTDFCFRARKRGFKTIYAPDAVAYHKLSPLKADERKRLLARSFFVGRNRLLFMKDYGYNFYLFLLFSPVYLVYFGIMATIEGDFRAFGNFMKGYIQGMIEGFKS